MYEIGPTGTLTLSGRIPAGSDPESIAIHPAGTFAYVAQSFWGSNDVTTYTINQRTGLLGSAGTTPPGTGAGSITIDSSGRFAYLANSLANDISMYTVDAISGALSSIGPPVQATGPTQTPWDGPNAVAVDPLGRFAYVAIRGDGGDMSDGSVSVYRINSTTGALTFASSVGGSCGALVSLCGPHAVAVDRSGKFAVAAGAFGGVSLYTIDATTGALTTTTTLSEGTEPDTTLRGSVAFHPTGPFVYVTNSGSNNVLEYTIDPSMGTLTSIGTIAAGSAPTSIAIDPSGSFAYVANVGSNDVSMYSIDPIAGTLTLLGTMGT
jgi:YVTN family beta-propeller protein